MFKKKRIKTNLLELFSFLHVSFGSLISVLYLDSKSRVGVCNCSELIYQHDDSLHDTSRSHTQVKHTHTKKGKQVKAELSEYN